MEFLVGIWESLNPTFQYVIISTVKILIVTVGVILTVAFSTYFERKVIGSMQSRVGPNRVGPMGLGQPFADVIKLLVKEVIVPSQSNKFLFVEPLPLHDCAAVVADSGAGDLGGHAVTPGLRHRRHQRRSLVRARADVGRRVRRDPCRLGDQFEIRVAGRDALGRANRRIRDRNGLCAGRCPDGGRQPEPR